jgi:hypothetical protein
MTTEHNGSDPDEKEAAPQRAPRAAEEVKVARWADEGPESQAEAACPENQHHHRDRDSEAEVLRRPANQAGPNRWYGVEALVSKVTVRYNSSAMSNATNPSCRE